MTWHFGYLVVVALYIVHFLVFRYLKKRSLETPRQIDDHLTPFFRTRSLYLVWCGLLICLLASFGVDVTAALGGVGIASMGLAMAAKGEAGNLFGTLRILLSGRYDIGQTVSIGEKYEGKIIEIGSSVILRDNVTGDEHEIPPSHFSDVVITRHK